MAYIGQGAGVGLAADATVTNLTVTSTADFNGTADFANEPTGVQEIFTTTIGGSGGTTDWTGSDPYTAAMTVSGILSTDVPVVDINLSSVAFADVSAVQSDWALVYRVAATADDEVTFYATAEPTEDLIVQIKVVR
jgi:hypothetical protein